VDAVQIPDSLARGAMERGEAGALGGVAVGPLSSSVGAPFGLLFVERPEPFLPPDVRLLAQMGRLAGEAWTSARSHSPPSRPLPALVGQSLPFLKFLEDAVRTAGLEGPVVIHGEPGTGRSHAAASLHARARRAPGPLVEVDAREGTSDVAALLLRADGGTLLIKNVDLHPAVQRERLLRHRDSGMAPDVRVIATSTAPLDAPEAIQIGLPPLRERSQDVGALFDHFARAAPGARQGDPPRLTPDARRLLTGYPWPGNVRELQLVAERLASLYAGGKITALELPPEIQQGATGQVGRSLQAMVQRLERDAVSEALREAGGKKIRAAALLGISRPTLDKKIEDYSLMVEKHGR
jgi:DNA-binding NtrC family response regulator